MSGVEYADRVMDIIAERLPTPDLDRRVIFHAIADHHMSPSDRLEIILDDAGNWRLKAASPVKGRGRVRLADYRMHMIGKPEDPAVTAVNEALEGL